MDHRRGGIDVVLTDPLFPPVVSGVTLVLAAALGTYRPWGRTPRGRRVLARSRPAAATARPPLASER